MKFSLIQFILLATMYGTKDVSTVPTFTDAEITNLIDSQPVATQHEGESLETRRRIFDEWFETVREDYMKELEQQNASL
uniref:Uncharacterized protein n=1 Tax=Trichobilharzia regenti TaxID=157069 RepID=A0AA85ISC8_TRIRE|nr:unnamed protein product [Trichobilharzia regenti]